MGERFLDFPPPILADWHDLDYDVGALNDCG